MDIVENILDSLIDALKEKKNEHLKKKRVIARDKEKKRQKILKEKEKKIDRKKKGKR